MDRQSRGKGRKDRRGLLSQHKIDLVEIELKKQPWLMCMNLKDKIISDTKT